MLSILNKKSVGFDVADRSIEVVEIGRDGDNVDIAAVGRVELTPGIVERGEIVDEKKLAMAVTEAMSKAAPKAILAKTAVFGLPEGKMYTHIFRLPVKKKKSVAALVDDEARSSIPLDGNDLEYSYKIIDPTVNDSGGERILLVAASRKIVASWQEFFAKLGIDISLFDSEIMATYRGLKKEKKAGGTCVVDIGTLNTNIAVFNGSGMFYSYSVNCGGDLFTKEIAEHWKKADGSKTDAAEAEKIKIDHGMTECQGENKDICQILKNTARPIVDEVKNAMNIFSDRTGEKVSVIILTGGGANMKGLENYFFESISPINPGAAELPIDIIDVKAGEPLVAQGQSPQLFIEAIGLARRAFSGPWDKTDPALNKIDLGKRKKAVSSPVPAPVPVENTETQTKFNWLKDHPKEMQLIVVLILGFFLIGGAFWYRQSSANQRLKNLKAKNANPYIYQASFQFSAPVDTGSGLLKTGEARGRIITEKVDRAVSYEEAIQTARTAAEKELKSGEALWRDNIIEKQDKKKIVFPITTQWLAYFEADVAGAYLAEAKKQLGPKADFILKDATFDKVEHAGTSSVYMLSGIVNLMTAKQFAGAVATSTNAAPEEKPAEAATATPISIQSSSTPATGQTSDKVEIKSVKDLMAALEAAKSMAEIAGTPEGWVNARVEPNNDAPIVKKVNDGEKYLLLEEKDGWTKVKISDSDTGWIKSDFITRAAP